MTTEEQARWLNEYDNRHDSHWGVIQVGGKSPRATIHRSCYSNYSKRNSLYPPWANSRYSS